jgi:hypothetical protein
MKPLAPLYDRLAWDERFPAAVDAIGRGDVEELARLTDSCPERKYWSIDVEYAERMKAAWVIAALAGNMLLRARVDLEVPMFVHDFLEQFSRPMADFATALDARNQIDANEEWQDFHRTVAAAYETQVMNLIGTCEGIKRSCDFIGVAPSALLVLAPGSMAVWELGTRLRESHGHDETVAETVTQSLTGCWTAITPSEKT